MRVLIVNSMFYTTSYRRCVDELALIEDITLTALTVDAWQMNGRTSRTEALRGDAPYNFIKGKALWKGKENRGFYTSGISRAFKLSKPDIIFLMEEPFSLFALQILFFRTLLYPQAPIVFFTWNNLSYDEFDYRPALWYRMVSRWVFARSAGALTANDDAITVLRNSGFAQPIKKIGYGVATETLIARNEEKNAELKKRFAIADDELVIGYVGRILEMKGLDLLLQAFSELRDPKIKLLLVGSGDYEQRLHKLSLSLNISDRVIHIQSVAHNEVAPLMQIMNILVLPSRRVGMWAEQFGRVLIEAMAAKVIVIGSSSGAIGEVIGDGGFVFEENNASSLLQKIKEALSLSNAERDALIHRGIQRAVHTYSWANFADQAAGFLRSILRRNR